MQRPEAFRERPPVPNWTVITMMCDGNTKEAEAFARLEYMISFEGFQTTSEQLSSRRSSSLSDSSSLCQILEMRVLRCIWGPRICKIRYQIRSNHPNHHNWHYIGDLDPERCLTVIESLHKFIYRRPKRGSSTAVGLCTDIDALKQLT